MDPISLAFIAGLYVYDGDTLRIGQESYRLINYNSPELHAQCTSEQFHARAARDKLRQLVTNPTAKLYPLPCTGYNYGRKCGRLEVNGKDIAGEMVKAGLAEFYTCGLGRCPKRSNWCSKPFALPQ